MLRQRLALGYALAPTVPRAPSLSCCPIPAVQALGQQAGGGETAAADGGAGLLGQLGVTLAGVARFMRSLTR